MIRQNPARRWGQGDQFAAQHVHHPGAAGQRRRFQQRLAHAVLDRQAQRIGQRHGVQGAGGLAETGEAAPGQAFLQHGLHGLDILAPQGRGRPA